MKLLISLFITLFVLSLSGVSFGFWKLYELVPEWLFYTSLSIYFVMILLVILVAYRMYKVAVKFIKDTIKSLKDWVKSLSIKEIIKIILGIIK